MCSFPLLIEEVEMKNIGSIEQKEISAVVSSFYTVCWTMMTNFSEVKVTHCV